MTRCGSYRDVHVTWIFQRRGWGQSGGGKIRGARKEFMKLTLRAFALHGQFASSTQLIKPICLGIPSPTQHHGFFRNLPIFFNTLKTDTQCYLMFLFHNPLQDGNNQIIINLVVIHCTKRQNCTFTVICDEQKILSSVVVF